MCGIVGLPVKSPDPHPRLGIPLAAGRDGIDRALRAGAAVHEDRFALSAEQLAARDRPHLPPVNAARPRAAVDALRPGPAPVPGGDPRDDAAAVKQAR